MAHKLPSRIREEARQRFDIHDAAIVHRLGRLVIGECSIAIAVSAPHRDAAFEACRFIIEAIKKDVPIWKKEIWQSGDASWVDSTAK
jgi:molybdopterin synthase catalytic subunit